MTPTNLNAPRIPLTDVPRILGRRVHINTLHRWATRGVRGVKLRTELVGGRRYTTEQWAREFVAALSGEKAIAAARPDLEAALRARGV